MQALLSCRQQHPAPAIQTKALTSLGGCRCWQILTPCGSHPMLASRP